MRPASRIPLLDDTDSERALDPSDMMGLLMRFPGQCVEGARLGDQLPEDWRAGVDSVVVAGMGGSAIGGDMLACLLHAHGRVPVLTSRSYSLPAFAGRRTLVIAASYSGNTEETLAAVKQAIRRRAQIVCITSGGALADLAETHGLHCIRIPGGQPPRASTGYLFFPMVTIAQRLGLFTTDVRRQTLEAVGLLERMAEECGPRQPLVQNPAKQLAQALHRRIPVVYGVEGCAAVAATRWKTQFNENAKCHLFATPLPEQNHNEILAWTASSLQATRWAVVYLRDSAGESPQIQRRFQITRELIGNAASHHEVWSRGESLVARMLSLIYLGDFTSVYLAYLNRQDPTVIPAIDALKRRLAQK